MAQVKSRENTFKIDLSNFPKRPSFEDLHKFVHFKLGLQLEQIKRLQMSHAQNCAYVKCSELKIAQDIVAMHNEKHEVEVNDTKIKIRLIMEDGGIEVKIHDLSENVTNDEVVAFLRQYGEVIGIKELTWGNSFAFKGISTGVRVVKMILRRHIKSFVVVHGEQTLITYRNQPQTCRHCTNLTHIGISCVENKRLMGQKTDLNARLNAIQTGTNSYAQALKKRPTDNVIFPVLTNLNNANREATTAAQTQPADDRTEHSEKFEEVPTPDLESSKLSTDKQTSDKPCVATPSVLDRTSPPLYSSAKPNTSWAEDVNAEEPTIAIEKATERGSLEKRSLSPSVSMFKHPRSVEQTSLDTSMDVSENDGNFSSDLSDSASCTPIRKSKREIRKLKRLKT